MDLIRWTEIGRGLRSFGFEVDLVTPRTGGITTLAGLPVRDAACVDWSEYDTIKVCYQRSIRLVPPHPNIIARMCRVTDSVLPVRDAQRRAEILSNQARVRDLARFVAVNDSTNAERWERFYGTGQTILYVPTGCPEIIPEPDERPYPSNRRIVLYCGALTAPRLVGVLNAAARRLRARRPDVELHFLGRNRLQHYGGADLMLDPGVIRVHGAVDETTAWNYMLHADVGLALAFSEDVFENELSKIYYYLRAGLPVVTEHTAMNAYLVEETGHGAIGRYADVADLVAKIEIALELRSRDRRVMSYMAERHGWRRRAQVYADALRQTPVAHESVVPLKTTTRG
jgi:glycosyltransferase involved in cell wall biosynthesis